MPHLTRELILTAVLVSPGACQHSGSVNNPPKPAYTGVEVAQRLKEWSELQPEPFVISFKGEFLGERLQSWGSLVSNIGFDPHVIEAIFEDTLHIDAWGASVLERTATESQLRSIMRVEITTAGEEEMVELLDAAGLKLAMMNYDSLTVELNRKLIYWCTWTHHPPQVLRFGYHILVHEGPNAGGHSRPWFTHSGAQNLQYFTLHLADEDLHEITNSIDETTSAGQLQKIMSAVADLEMYDTSWGPE